MIVIIAKVDVNWGHAFEGYIPSKQIFAQGGVYTCNGSSILFMKYALMTISF